MVDASVLAKDNYRFVNRVNQSGCKILWLDKVINAVKVTIRYIVTMIYRFSLSGQQQLQGKMQSTIKKQLNSSNHG